MQFQKKFYTVNLTNNEKKELSNLIEASPIGVRAQYEVIMYAANSESSVTVAEVAASVGCTQNHARNILNRVKHVGFRGFLTGAEISTSAPTDCSNITVQLNGDEKEYLNSIIEGDSTPTQKQRAQILLLLSSMSGGHRLSNNAIANKLQCDRVTVKNVLKSYAKRGVTCVRRARPIPSKVSTNKASSVEDDLNSLLRDMKRFIRLYEEKE